VEGTELVVWRDHEGSAHAWLNRCPHRGMRLSFGYVDGQGRLACRYHGWRYAGEGRCAAVPAHPDRPPPDDVAVPVFACLEENELIWIAPNGDRPGPRIGATGPAPVFCRSLVARATPDRVVEALGAATYPDEGGRAELLGGNVIRVGTGTEAVTAVLQPIDDGRTGVHLLAASASMDREALRLSVSAWGRRLRRRIEDMGAADG
jgi:nitrite reductase/ring-hydroxylating ferredoxin subunit